MYYYGLRMDTVQRMILEAIAKGYSNERELSDLLNMDKVEVEEELRDMNSKNLIAAYGIWLPLIKPKKYKLTRLGYKLLFESDFQNEIPRKPMDRSQTKQEIKHTTTMGTGFKLALGGLLGFVFAWILSAALASLLLWVGYRYVKTMLPTSLVLLLDQYIGNPLIFILIGVILSLSALLKLRPSKTSI